LVSLDVGCGENKQAVIGVDIRRLKGVDVVCDVHFLPFRDEVFDMVRSSVVVEHVLNPYRFFAEQFRVLKKGGAIYCEADNARYWRYHLTATPFEADFVKHFKSEKYDASREHLRIYYPECIMRLFKHFGAVKIRMFQKHSQKKLDKFLSWILRFARPNFCSRFIVIGEKCRVVKLR